MAIVGALLLGTVESLWLEIKELGKKLLIFLSL